MYCTVQSDITSKNTSINSKKLPAIYNRLDWDALRERWAKITKFDRTPIVLDFGCGRYTDHIEQFLATKGFIFRGYDPFWKPVEENNIALSSGLCYDPYIVICSNVLNVIADKETAKEIQTYIRDFSFSSSLGNNLVREPSFYFITVYEGNKSGIGRMTKPDCFQRNETLDNYIFRYEDVIYKNTITTENGKMFLK